MICESLILSSIYSESLILSSIVYMYMHVHAPVSKRNSFQIYSHQLTVLFLTHTHTDSLSQGYQTSWLCQGKYDAFVDGGMFFNQTEEKLQVPECGYYYIASKISFQVSENTTQFVKHEILVDRNCSDPMTQFRLRSHASVGAGKNIYASTFIGDTIKICAGGKISVFIPTRQTPCCPYGDSIATYLSVHLVQKTGCGRPSITSSRN